MTTARRTVIVTRPRDQALSLATRLEQKGFHVIAEPGLVIATIEQGLEAIRLAQHRRPGALVLTSARAAERLSAAWFAAEIVVHAVGEATAQAARQAGFTRVEVSGPTAREMCAVVASMALEGPVLYPCGVHLAYDVVADLAGRGIPVMRVPVYDAAAAESLEPETLAALRKGASVLFFSPRTAQTFVQLTERAGASLKQARAYCLSDRIADALSMKAWKAVRVAQAIEESSLIALLEADA